MKKILKFFVSDNSRHFFLSDAPSGYYHGEFEDFLLYQCLNQETQAELTNHPFITEAEKYLDRFGNPYKYSLDNKRYLTWDAFSKLACGRKLVKVPIDAGFSCPNRDGTLSSLGCLFCAGGSNAIPWITGEDLVRQYEQRKQVFMRKWPDFYPLAYFQSYSNTYSDLDHLKQAYQPFIENDEIKGIVISTRSDCLDREKISWLDSLTAIKPIWLELGLQSIHDQTLKEMNRQHDYASFEKAIDALASTDIRISVHMINGWPSENEEMMLRSAQAIGKMPIHAVKFHMLHVLKNTPLAARWPFDLISKERYVEITARQLTLLRPDIIIERLTGDGFQKDLLGPDWTRKKTSVINDIDKWLVSNNSYQGSAL